LFVLGQALAVEVEVEVNFTKDDRPPPQTGQIARFMKRLRVCDAVTKKHLGDA